MDRIRRIVTSARFMDKLQSSDFFHFTDVVSAADLVHPNTNHLMSR